MSLFDKLKKLVNKNEDTSSTSSSSSNNGSTIINSTSNNKPNEHEKNIFVNGLNGNKNVTTISYDNILNLCAVGFNDGTLKIFGKNGYEIPIKSYTNNAVKKIIFIVNSPYIIVITHTTIEKWDYSMQRLNNILVYKSRITAIYFSSGLKHLFFSTEDSIIQIYNVHNNFLSSYQISLPPSPENPNPVELDVKTSSVFPSCIKICPSNPNLMLVGYSNGLVVVWNIEVKRIEKRFDAFQQYGYCTSLSWSRKGTKFVCGFLNGEIYLISYPKGHSTCLYKTNTSADDNKSNNIKPIDGLEILYTISSVAANTSSGASQSSQSSQSSLLPSRKFILFRGTYQGDSKSLMIIKGDNLKNPSHLSTIQVASNVTSFHPITTLPYYSNNGNLVSILTIQQDQVVEYKLDPRTFFFSYVPINSINLKSFKTIPDVSIMKSYQCDPSTISLISQLVQSDPTPPSCINGGSPILDFTKQTAVPPRVCQLLITAERNNQIKFWNSTDSKNIVYLGCLNINNNININSNTSNDIEEDFNSGSDNVFKFHITTFSFSPSTLLLTVSINNLLTNSGSLLVYHISDFSKRIQIINHNINNQQVQSEQSKQLEQSIVNNQSEQSQSINNDQQSQEQQSQEQSSQEQSSQEQPQSSSPSRSTSPSPLPSQISNPYDQLPNPVFEIFKFMGEIKLDNEIVTSIAMNSYKTSYSTRILLGTSSSKVYHFIVSIKSNQNSSNDNPIPSSQVVYSLSIINLGSTEKLTSTMNTLSSPVQQQQQQQQPVNLELVSITSISFCFYPIRENDIDSSIVYLGSSNGCVFILDLQNMKIISIFKQNISSPVESIQFMNKRGEPIQYLFFGTTYHDDAEDGQLLSSLSNLSLSSSSGNNNNNINSEEFKSNIDDILVLVSSRKEISLYNVTFGQQKSIQNKRLSKHEFKNHPLLDEAAYLSTLPNDSNNKPVIVTMDSRNQVEFYNPSNLEKISSFSITSLINHNNILASSSTLNIKFTVSLLNSNLFIYLNQNNQNGNKFSILYTLCLNKNELNQFPSLFVDNVPMPNEVRKQSVFSKLFSSSASPQDQILALDEKFSQEGVSIPNPYISNTNSNNNNSNISNTNRQVMEVANILQQAKEQMQLRGEKINEIQEKSQEMENNAKNFAALTRQLAKK